MRLIVWLWNPWVEYQNTRHNAGFLAIEAFRKQMNFPEFEASRHFGVVSEGMIQGERIILLKPTTFMNLSGKSVSSLSNFYKIAPENILVLSDDIDQEFGKARFRLKGSSGGQNGLQSIIESLGTDAFSRVKIGVGRDERYTVSDWVLSRFSKEELQELDTIFEEVFEKIDGFLWK